MAHPVWITEFFSLISALSNSYDPCDQCINYWCSMNEFLSWCVYIRKRGNEASCSTEIRIVHYQEKMFRDCALKQDVCGSPVPQPLKSLSSSATPDPSKSTRFTQSLPFHGHAGCASSLFHFRFVRNDIRMAYNSNKGTPGNRLRGHVGINFQNWASLCMNLFPFCESDYELVHIFYFMSCQLLLPQL